MNIYAIFDRMLTYYQQPFIANDEKQVLAALAQTVNSKEKNNAIAQAPNHFELWQIGTINFAELGDKTFVQTECAIVKAEQRLIATLDSLIRGGVRENGGHEGPELETPAGQGTGNAQRAPRETTTKHPPTR